MSAVAEMNSGKATRRKAIAFYLPQYHPIPENDRWWGTGFTEWHNVARAKPLFADHYQPHLPADLGFYDRRVPEVRQQQADLARQYGIGGFYYYHYWFEGKRLLERPVTEMLATGEPNFPFCLCWANENWTRRWDGLDQEVLITQQYSPSDDSAHFEYLLPYFYEPHYIRIQNKQLFLVYRASDLPNPHATTDLWRQMAQINGFEGLHLVKVESFPDDRQRPPEHDGFDAALDFQPNGNTLPIRQKPSRSLRLLHKLGFVHQDPYIYNVVFLY